jgi:hypothetical protein
MRSEGVALALTHSSVENRLLAAAPHATRDQARLEQGASIVETSTAKCDVYRYLRRGARSLLQIVEMLVQVPAQLLERGREIPADLESADRLRENTQRVTFEVGLHVGITVKRSAERRLNRASCGRLICMHQPDRADEVEQVRFIQPTLIGAGQDASARRRRRRTEKCSALRSVFQWGVIRHDFPTLLLHPDLVSDAELAVAPHGHRKSLNDGRIRLRHKCAQARLDLGARPGNSIYGAGVIRFNRQEGFHSRPDPLVPLGESFRVFVAP